MTVIRAANHIVIGDVGSGKTIVAFVSAIGFLHGVERGQVALLAPTEILSYQHYLAFETLKKKLALPWLHSVYLAGKRCIINGVELTKTEWSQLIDPTHKKHIKIIEKTSVSLADLMSRTMWIGTHALLFQDIVQPDVVLADEQHRFGVKQRKKLSKQGSIEVQSHFVSFTATPIPRTLALSALDSLKPLFLDRLAGRSHIQTQITSQDKFEQIVLPKIAEHLKHGHKVFVVCSRVEDEENELVWSVKKAAAELEKHFANQILITHGKEKSKQQTMIEFKESSHKNILVATTVIEVGVDVGLASLCIILSAEKFGLAALHQIRGRVGRNDYETNECVLVTSTQGATFSNRLKYLVDSNDGFFLAQKDLELRGSGSLFGTEQSGFEGDFGALMRIPARKLEELHAVVETVDTEQPEFIRLKKYVEKTLAQSWQE